MVQASAYDKYLGFLQLEFDDAGKVTSWAGQPILLDKTVEQGGVCCCSRCDEAPMYGATTPSSLSSSTSSFLLHLLLLSLLLLLLVHWLSSTALFMFRRLCRSPKHFLAFSIQSVHHPIYVCVYQPILISFRFRCLFWLTSYLSTTVFWLPCYHVLLL